MSLDSIVWAVFGAMMVGTMQWVTDLTPYFADRCWQYVLLARKAPVGVIIRSGPSKWWHLTLWDTQRDRFTSGQWFHGVLYPRKCDLSPDGKLFSYFAGKFRPTEHAAGYGHTRVAVSRPPYFTALALWPVDSTYGGHTAFDGDGTLHAGATGPHHPDHPPGPLRVVLDSYRKSPAVWEPVPLPPQAAKVSHFDPLLAACRKTVGSLCLERALERGEDLFPSRRRTLYTLYRQNARGGEATPLALFEAHWADFDQRLRLVASVGGRILEGRLDRRQNLRWREIAAFQDDKPEQMEAPA